MARGDQHNPNPDPITLTLTLTLALTLALTWNAVKCASMQQVTSMRCAMTCSRSSSYSRFLRSKMTLSSMFTCSG